MKFLFDFKYPSSCGSMVGQVDLSFAWMPGEPRWLQGLLFMHFRFVKPVLLRETGGRRRSLELLSHTACVLLLLNVQQNPPPPYPPAAQNIHNPTYTHTHAHTDTHTYILGDSGLSSILPFYERTGFCCFCLFYP